MRACVRAPCVRACVGTYGNFVRVWELMGTSCVRGYLWELMGTYGNFVHAWELMGTYGNLWELMGTSCMCCDPCVRFYTTFFLRCNAFLHYVFCAAMRFYTTFLRWAFTLRYCAARRFHTAFFVVCCVFWLRILWCVAFLLRVFALC